MGEVKKDNHLFISAAILLVVHVSGLIGIHTSYKELFLVCTPANLLLSLTLLLWNQGLQQRLSVVCPHHLLRGFFHRGGRGKNQNDLW